MCADMRAGDGVGVRAGPRAAARGFTLIEILMSLMVLSVGLASVLSVFVVGVRASRDVVDESAAAVAAKAALARVLSEDELPVSGPDGRRDFLEVIELARNANDDWVWLHDRSNTYAGGVGTEDQAMIPAPVPVAQGSRYCWRGRASRFRGGLNDPTTDLDVDGMGSYVPLARGRIPDGVDSDTGIAYWKDSTHPNNPDNDELWRLTIEVFRDIAAAVAGDAPLATFDTFVCTAHR